MKVSGILLASAMLILAASVGAGAQSAAKPGSPGIRFEDATDASGINFTHSFGSRQLGSLLEGTGAGCVWFDFNNDGSAKWAHCIAFQLIERDLNRISYVGAEERDGVGEGAAVFQVCEWNKILRMEIRHNPQAAVA